MILNIRDIRTVFISPNEGKYKERVEYMQNFLTNILGIKNVVHYKTELSTYHTNELKKITIQILKDYNDDEPLLILEDDIGLTEWYSNTNIEIEIPPHTDAIYLGIHRFGMHPYDDKLYFPIFESNYFSKYYSEELCKIECMLSAHAILYKSKKYKESVIQLFEESEYSVASDALLSRNMKNYIVYAYRKPIFYQKYEFSSYSMYWATYFEIELKNIDKMVLNLKDIKTVFINPDEGKYKVRKEYIENFLKNEMGIKNVVHYKSELAQNGEDYRMALKRITAKILQDHLDDEPLLIVEDDIKLTRWYNKDNIDIEIPPLTDAIYLGNHTLGIHDYDQHLFFYLNQTKCLIHYYSESICRILNMLCAHAIIYKSKKYKQSVIDMFKEDNIIFNDVLLARNMKNYMVYTYRKPIFYQSEDDDTTGINRLTYTEFDDEYLHIEKNLIYFSVGGTDDYFKLTKCCIDSIRKTNSYNTYDIMIMCDEKYKKNIDTYELHNVDFMTTDENTNIQQIKQRKFEIFSYSKIWNYKKVLYLDSSVLVNCNLKTFFDRVVEKDKIYVKEDPKEIFSPHMYFHEDTEVKCKENGVWFFNSGQFLFKVSSDMENHFNSILHNSKTHNSIYCDQILLNEYFISNQQVIADPIINDNIKVITSDSLCNDFDMDKYSLVNFALSPCPSVIDYNSMYNSMYSLYCDIIQLFDNRNDLIKYYIKDGFKIAEIGVGDGSLSHTLFETKPSELHCVDVWNGFVYTTDKDGNYGKFTNTNIVLSEIKRKFKHGDNLNIIQSDSISYLSSVEDNFYDMIYLDGDKTYEGVKRDIEVSFNKVKSGGYIMGHNYDMNYNKTYHVYNYGVKQAVDEFCITHKQKIIAKAFDGCLTFCIKIQK